MELAPFVDRLVDRVRELYRGTNMPMSETRSIAST